MALESREATLAHILVSEGSEPNVSPGEPGGASKYGVSVAALSDYRKRKGQPPATIDDVVALNEAQAREFYTEEFLPWIRFDDLPAGVDYRLADIETNLGRRGGTKLAQRVVGTEETGKMDDETMRRIADRPAADMIRALGEAWLAVKASQPAWALDHQPRSFRRGWQNRERAATAQALAMIGE